MRTPVDVEVSLVKPHGRGAPYSWRVLRCPVCGRRHRHGAGCSRRDVSRYLGTRLAHCGQGALSGFQYRLVWQGREDAE